MFNTLFSKGSLPLAEQWLYFTARRHEAIANNIANAVTPGYKAIDAPKADFEQAMERAIQARDARRVPIFSFEGFRSVKPRPGGGMSLEFQEPKESAMLRHTENNVDAEVEMGKLLTNAQRHNMVASIMTQQFNMLRTAISERIGG